MLLTRIDVIIASLIVISLIVIAVLRYKKWASSRTTQPLEDVYRDLVATLQDNGYRVLGSYRDNKITMNVDGRQRECSIRGGCLVTRGSNKFFALPDSRVVSKRVNTVAVRRQLLELLYAYQVSGVLLVNSEKRKVKEIRFRPSYSALNLDRIALFVLGIIVGLIIAGLRLQGGVA